MQDKKYSNFKLIKLFKLSLYLSLLSIIFLCNQVNAATNTWDFDTAGNYTISDSTSLEINSGNAELTKHLIHKGTITDNTDFNGADDVVVDGNYAYIANTNNDSISIVDISDITSPTLVSTLVDNAGTILLDGASGIVKNGNYLYIASRVSDAIQIIDVSDVNNPTAVSQLTNSPTSNRLNGVRGLAISGNYLFASSSSDHAIVVIDISDPLNPVWKNVLRDTTNLRGTRSLKVKGNFIYATSYSRDRFTSVDISDPENPFVADSITDTTNLNGAWYFDISGNYAYVGSYINDSIEIIDITNPTALLQITTINNGGSYLIDQPRDIEVEGDLLYITANTSDSLTVVDVSTPSSPVYIDTMIHSGGAQTLNGSRGLTVEGDTIYVAAGTSDGLEIINYEYSIESPSIEANISFDYTGLSVLGFSDILGANNIGNVTYQLSKDGGTTWYYYNGSSWLTTSGGTENSSNVTIINSNISSFNGIVGGTDTFTFKAFLNSNGLEPTQLDSVTVTISGPAKPGGVSTNLQIWLKADLGPNNTTDGSSVTTWSDQSENGYDATGGNSPFYRSNATDELNFNPVVDFNGTNQYLQNLNNGAYTQSYFIVVVPDNTVDGTLAGQVPYGFDCSSGILNTGTCGLDFAGVTLGAFTAAFNDEVITQAIGSSTGWRSSQLGLGSYEAGKPMLIGMNENSTGNGTDIYEKGESLNNYEANTYQTVSTTDYALGRSLDNTYPFYYDGKIAEIINYSDRISDNERIRIESYLSLKYGITLQSGTQDYTSTDGSTLMWSTSLAGVYNNDIFGIGYDSSTELGQVKSKSVNSDSIITIEAIGEGTNISNSFTDISDKEFLTISNDGAGNTWTSVGAPSGYYNLSRSWRVQETGEVGTVDLDFDVDNTDFDIPDLSIGTDYYFVYDSNNNDDLSDETPVAMVNTTGSIWTVTGTNLNHLREFTIATQASTNNIPTDITLSNTILNENISAGSVVGTLSTTDLDVGDTHTYTLVSGFGDEDNTEITLIGSTIYIIYSPDYEIKQSYNIRVQTNDGNGGEYQEELIITVNDIGETINSIIDFETEDKYDITSGSWIRDGLDVNEGSNSLRSDIAGIASTQACFLVLHTFSDIGTLEFDYKVSSQSGGDYLRFYIDNVEDSNWSGTVDWTTYSKTDVTAGLHEYKWCYIKNGTTNTGNDRSIIDYITFQNNSIDITNPTISGVNYSNDDLLPGGNHDIIFTYYDSDSGIDTNSDSISVAKWDGSTWGSDISSTALDLVNKTVTATQATYSTNDLDYGKYKFTFSIDDNDSNTGTSSIELYFDKPTITISTGSLDIGSITDNGLNFSNDEITITIETVGAEFDVNLSQDSDFEYNSNVIVNWDGSEGIGYDKTTYSSSNLNINSNQSLYSQGASLNTDGDLNTYVYSIKIGTLILEEQAAGNYETTLSFYLYLNY